MSTLNPVGGHWNRCSEKGFCTEVTKFYHIVLKLKHPILANEVALGYKEVEEPSVYVKFKLKDTNVSILAWTRTPTLFPAMLD